MRGKNHIRCGQQNAIKHQNRTKCQTSIKHQTRTKPQGRVKMRYLLVAVGLLLSVAMGGTTAQAFECPNVRVVFARGSGGERWTDQNYLAYKNTIEEKLATTSLSYEFIDLDYPAIGIGDLDVLLGAYFGAGESYEFGESVAKGSSELINLVNSTSCPDTRYVIGGYSQGAIVVSRSLSGLKSERLIYAATFGDPKIYLPEGKGLLPAACRGENLSDYRMYVPDCQAYKGMLGGYVPYEPEALVGKVGTWCNKRDLFCSSHLNITDHVSYVAENLYEDAARVIFDKVCKAFGVENSVSSPHDTAILIDSTGSMASMIKQYKEEAMRLARETLDTGGRVALYDYRDLNDHYNPVKRCDFGTCTLESFEKGLREIVTSGGGDRPESLLSASFHTMSELEWKQGSTKSLVILTDADFLSPDRDGMTFDEVVRLSKEIDPVNFYIITNAKSGDAYKDLATATDGKVVTNFDELSLLTDYIIERYDSLPRVEEKMVSGDLPILIIEETLARGNEATIHFSTTGEKTIVILNDAILGVTDETDITITGLRTDIANTLVLVPIGGDVRGEPVEAKLNNRRDDSDADNKRFDVATSDIVITNTGVVVPRVPNTGKR